MAVDTRDPAQRDRAPELTRLPLSVPQGFTSLGLVSNSIVMTSSKGSQVLAPEEIETGSRRWATTSPGINGVSPDGRWLGIYRPFGASLFIYRLPGLEPVAKLTHPISFGDFQFSPSGDEVAITSLRAGVLAAFWNTTTWTCTRTLTNFSRVLYTPDARALWLTKDQRNAGLYDARTLEPLLLLPTGMLPLALSPDGQRVAVSVDAQRLQRCGISPKCGANCAQSGWTGSTAGQTARPPTDSFSTVRSRQVYGSAGRKADDF